MTRRHICDVPGCDRERQRWQRLCTRCFSALSRDTRTRLIGAWDRGDKPAWRKLRRAAGTEMSGRLGPLPAPTGSRPPPSVTYANNARLLGEHD